MSTPSMATAVAAFVRLPTIHLTVKALVLQELTERWVNVRFGKVPGLY